VTGNSTHAGLNNRHVQAAQIKDWGHRPQTTVLIPLLGYADGSSINERRTDTAVKRPGANRDQRITDSRIPPVSSCTTTCLTSRRRGSTEAVFGRFSLITAR
jgi:hypothetical protein